MKHEFIKNKLKKLRHNLLADDSDDISELLSLAKAFDEGNYDVLIDTYISQNAPVQVTDFDVKLQRDGDMSKVLEEFSCGIDDFITGIKSDSDGILTNYKEAMDLLKTIISLRMPYSLILYLRYYKCLSNKEVMTILRLGRTVYFEKLDKAYCELEQKILPEVYNQ